MKKYSSKKVKEIVDNEILDPEFKEVINDVISYSEECEIFFEDSEDIVDFDQYYA